MLTALLKVGRVAGHAVTLTAQQRPVDRLAEQVARIGGVEAQRIRCRQLHVGDGGQRREQLGDEFGITRRCGRC